MSNKDCGWLIAVLLRVKANGWYPPVSVALVQLLMEKVQCPLSTNCSRQSPIGIGRKSLHSYTTKLTAGGREGGREGERGGGREGGRERKGGWEGGRQGEEGRMGGSERSTNIVFSNGQLTVQFVVVSCSSAGFFSVFLK